MHRLIRAQNWLFRQILIYPLRNAIVVLAMVALVGWGLFGTHHRLTEHYYPVLVLLALANLGFSIARHRRRRPPPRRGYPGDGLRLPPRPDGRAPDTDPTSGDTRDWRSSRR